MKGILYYLECISRTRIHVIKCLKIKKKLNLGTIYPLLSKITYKVL